MMVLTEFTCRSCWPPAEDQGSGAWFGSATQWLEAEAGRVQGCRGAGVPGWVGPCRARAAVVHEGKTEACSMQTESRETRRARAVYRQKPRGIPRLRSLSSGGRMGSNAGGRCHEGCDPCPAPGSLLCCPSEV